MGPRKNRFAQYAYFFAGANVSSLIARGDFSGFVDPGPNFTGLQVQVTPRKRSGRRKRKNIGVTVRAFDTDTTMVVDGVRARLKKR